MDNSASHQSSGNRNGSNYWRLLAAAVDALAVGDFPAAERRYQDACDLRDASPGRVFITEKIGDGLRRLFGQRSGQTIDWKQRGRWVRASREFVNEYRAAGEQIVREGVRLAELRPEDDAETNQPILESALFLVARSRIFQDEPGSAVSLLRGVFRTAARTGRPFSVDLVRHDLPLTEEDRLWMARKGGALVESFVEQGHLRQGSPAAVEWADVFLQLLQERYFSSTGRLAEERAWLEAITADRLLGRAAASVELYRAYLVVNPEPGPRPDEARVRLLELLANTHEMNFPVPRYTEALGAMQAAGLAAGSAAVGRFEEALARLEYRRPDGETAAGVAPAWASAAVEPDGRVAIVFWWDNEPRDLAFWSPGDSIESLTAFLEPCAGRLLAADTATLAACSGRWPDEPAPWTVQDYVVALLESRLPASGLDPAALLSLAMAETSPWRSGWRPGLGHPALEPPHSSALVETWQQGAAVGAIQAGLLFLAVRSRVGESDIALRAGIGEMARRGDAATRFLYEFLTLDSAANRALDASFEPWTLPLLWTRPDPFGWSTTGGPGAGGPGVAEVGIRPDLGRSDLTIVTTGNAAAVLAAWGDGKQKWRVVLDRMDRLESLAQVAGSVMGPVTLIPGTGEVHSLAESLRLLDDLLAKPQGGLGGLLPLFHWARLVETHNGDLLDFQQVRPRLGCRIDLYEMYADLVDGLPRERPSLAADGSLNTETLRTWGGQFSQRVRKAGLVAGCVDHLTCQGQVLDGLWGVFEGSDAAWVFLDSAAVHWSLHARGQLGIQELHTLLHSRGGRHLSLLSAATWQRTELEELLADWLQVFGSAYCLTLTDTRAPVLRLVNRGVRPEASLAGATELAGQVTWINHRFAEEGAGTVQVPQSGRAARFWVHVRDGDLLLAGPDWSFLDAAAPSAGLPAAALVVPVLQSLGGGGVPVARDDTRAAWAAADAERETYLDWRRKLCALEIASLLAGHWRSVDILDTRWWRLLPPPTISGPGRTGTWQGEAALAVATNHGARGFDLPGCQGVSGSDNAIDSRALEVVQAWLARQEKPGPGRTPVAAPVREPETGTQLLVGDLAPRWEELARYLTLQGECGDLSQWLLFVGDCPPPGAAELVANGFVAGLSVWAEGARAEVAAPVLWARPVDLADSGLRELIAARPPRVIVADDLADWLPRRGHDGQDGAVALRAILDSGAGSVILRAGQLDPSWGHFLTGACRTRQVGSGSEPPPLTTAPGSGPDEYGGCVDCGWPDRPAALAERLRILLRRVHGIVAETTGEPADPAQTGSTPPGRQLLPLDWLGRLAGMDDDAVREGVLLLRWVARLHGDSLSAAGEMPSEGEGDGHSLLIPHRFAELEPLFERLAENLALLLPLWLAETSVPGLWGQIDLEHPPARMDPRELALVDAFLAAVATGHSYDSDLVYVCPRGMLNSALRLVGWEGRASEAVPAILATLDVFVSRVREVLGSALETGEGFRVDTGLKELRSEESDFMGLGVVLGLWRWLGPPCPGGLHLVDLLTVADSPTVRQSPLGWELFRAQTASRFPAAVADLPTAPETESRRRERPRLGQLRRLLTTGVEASDDLDQVVARVHEVTRAAGDPALVVLRGMLGTGRHEALVRGLLRTLHQADDPGPVVIHCPDTAVAAMVSREFLVRGYRRALDLRIPGPGDGLASGPNALPALAEPGTSVVVMCEVQRFDPEVRYRVAQTGRGKLLVMTADPVASVEPWEHLFLTTPRANEIVELSGQRHLSKALWNEVQALAPVELQPNGGSRRHARGNLESGYAANLVQSLARVVAAQQEGTLPATLRLTAPLAADLEYLGAQLQERGWLAVMEPELDVLLVPGAREILAAATDVLIRSGDVALAVPTVDQHAGEEPDSLGEPADSSPDNSPDDQRELLTPLLLGPEAVRQWQAWRAADEPDAEVTLAEFVGRLLAAPWANTFLRYPDTRHRCQDLLARWGNQPLRSLLASQVWGAWWQTMTADLGVWRTSARRPLALLSDTASLPGSRVPGAAYLCLGTEPARQHYEFLGRAGDSALVLYQERSPLPGEAPA